MTKKVLILGSGFVAGPVVEFLSKTYQLTVASNVLSEAKKLALSYQNTDALEIDVTDESTISILVSKHDLVISLVPYIFHIAIAKKCIEHGKPLVTASYVSPEMQALHEQARESGVPLINEIGLDPGIDHMSAMKVINDAHQRGGKVISFSSWCGGLPAPEHNNNPLGYKFAWAPRGVLLALQNAAVYLKNNRCVDVPASELLQSAKAVELSEELKLEGYPNRNSLPYREAYDIPECENLLRGTLRYPGFSEIMNVAAEVGLLDDKESVKEAIVIGEWFEQRLATKSVEISAKAKQAFSWLGLTSRHHKFLPEKSLLDSFCELLQQKLTYDSNEVDMIALQHRFAIQYSTEKKYIHSTLVVEGEEQGFSAMAKTVGYPVAIAAELVMRKQFNQSGVIIPVMKELYEPVLQKLEQLGIACVETEHDILAEEFFAN